MLYLGQFSFDPGDAGDDEEDGDAADEGEGVQHGYFTVLASAETVADAFEKFKILIPRIGKENELFDSGTHVYLDACIEVRELPAEGLFAHVVIALDGEHSIAASLLGAPTGAGQAYGWGEHARDDEIASAAIPAPRGDAADIEPIGEGDDELDDDEGGADVRDTRDVSHIEPFLVVR
jgi:hypothetical protein